MTAQCTTRLANGPLVCVLPADHAFGCAYIASGCPDLHDASENAAEVSRG